MVESHTQQWGRWEVLRIHAPEHRSGFDLVPQRGACLTRIELSGRDLLDGYRDAAGLDSLDWGKSILLAPFPNRLRDGRYQWEGKTYQFPCNETDRHNALHGFVMDQSFEVTDQGLSETSAFVELAFTYDGSLPYYPFPFRMKVRYELDAPAAFSAFFEMENTGAGPMPAGLGWHPYFHLGKEVGALSLQLPAADQIVVDERMLPTGERVPLDRFQELSAIGDAHFDTGFSLREKDGVEVWLGDGVDRLRYWQDGNFPFLQVFIPPARRSIALEPMTCNIDAFNNGQGLKRLEPGERLAGKAGISLL